MNVLGEKPKRPLYYTTHAIRHLPDHGVRDIIRYVGDYIDHLVRFALEDKKFLAKWFCSPLGPNIKKLEIYINTNLYDK